MIGMFWGIIIHSSLPGFSVTLPNKDVLEPT